MTVTIHEGDSLAVLRTLESESVQLVCTSPPYFQLRDYQVAGQIGLESTPAAFLDALFAVFDEVKRVLRKDGTLWCNLGDSYSGSGKGGYSSTGIVKDHVRKQGFDGDTRYRSSTLADGRVAAHNGYTLAERVKPGVDKTPDGIPAKNLLLMPERFAIGMQDRGWICRSRIAWCKTSAMPESVVDRPTSAWEHIYMFSKSPRYFYDQEATRQPFTGHAQGSKGVADDQKWLEWYGDDGQRIRHGKGATGLRTHERHAGANLRNFWLLGPEPSSLSLKTETRVDVSVDDADDDTERTTSPDCPVHGSHPVATARRGEPLADPQTRTPHNGTDRVLAPPGEDVPTADLFSAAWGQTLSSDHAAIVRNTASSRTDPRAATTPACIASEETSSSTGDRSTQHDDGSPRHGRGESSRAVDCAGDETGSRQPEQSEPSTDDTEARAVAPALPLSDCDRGTASHTASSRTESARDDPSADTQPGSLRTSSCTCSYSKTIIRESAHFAQFPPEIPRRCILAGSRKGDTVLDPFLGSGTTALVADRLGRSAIGIELSPTYCDLARKRLDSDAPLWSEPVEVVPAEQQAGLWESAG